MGTRADFYIGRGVHAVWAGSLAWDGYPKGIHSTILEATSDREFLATLVAYAKPRKDWNGPNNGWPWPWTTSDTTDYAYALDDGKVWASCFGHDWFDPLEPEPDQEEDSTKTAVFPDMTDQQNVTFGNRSGLIIL